ncbi:MAG: hypothetical protein WBF23_13360 [Methyloceanibacter sp.]
MIRTGTGNWQLRDSERIIQINAASKMAKNTAAEPRSLVTLMASCFPGSM